MAVVTVVTLRQDFAAAAGTDTASLVTTGNALASTYKWAFLIGPGLMAAVNAAMLAPLLYRSRLVPRVIPTIGLVAIPVLAASVTAAFFGLHELTDPVGAIATMPIFVWELSLGVYMAVKGFKPSPITDSAAIQG
jgi:hypothetical protein